MHCNEFVLLWFEEDGRWHVVFSGGRCAASVGGSVGVALGFALRHLEAAEADFRLVKETGDYYRYRRDI